MNTKDFLELGFKKTKNPQVFEGHPAFSVSVSQFGFVTLYPKETEFPGWCHFIIHKGDIYYNFLIMDEDGKFRESPFFSVARELLTLVRD